MKTMKHSRGVALIVGLIFLIILTLFVLGGLRDVLLQERMSGSYRNQSLAENATDSLLRNGESRVFNYIVSTNGSIDLPGAVPLDADQAVAPDPVVRSFRTGSGYPTNAASAFAAALVPNSFQNAADNTSALSQAGAYVIEQAVPVSVSSTVAIIESHTGDSSTGGSKGQLYMFRVTSRATGGTDDYVKAAESYYLITK
jgi:type IV pilus assembly protein PilX